MDVTAPKSVKPWTQPIIRWAGSKRKLVPLLAENVPRTFETYIEPFAGSACLFFALKPRKAILGDINKELLATYETIRAHPRQVHRLVASWWHRQRDYYEVRGLYTAELTPLERAARFIYLNRLCFNGIYRTNRKGLFNVPIGKKTGQLQSESEFYRCSVALRGTQLFAGDFSTCLEKACENDFLYLDPPYAVTGKRTSGEYGCHSFSPPDIPRLMTALNTLDQRGVRFLLSYAESEEIKSLLPTQWKCRDVSVRRHIAGFAKHRGDVTEVLISNY